MANQFLVEIHNYISQQMASSRQARSEAEFRSDRARVKLCDGRLEELQQLRRYLGDHFDLETQSYY